MTTLNSFLSHHLLEGNAPTKITVCFCLSIYGDVGIGEIMLSHQQAQGLVMVCEHIVDIGHKVIEVNIIDDPVRKSCIVAHYDYIVAHDLQVTCG